MSVLIETAPHAESLLAGLHALFGGLSMRETMLLATPVLGTMIGRRRP